MRFLVAKIFYLRNCANTDTLKNAVDHLESKTKPHVGKQRQYEPKGSTNDQ